MLASDFAFNIQNGRPFPDSGKGGLSSHPAPNGSVSEYFQEENSVGGFVLDDSHQAPTNFADADGSVQTFKVSGNSANDADNWVVNNHSSAHPTSGALLPKDLAR